MPALDSTTAGGSTSGRMRVLIADDDTALAASLTAFVESCGHHVVATITSGGLDVLYAYDQLKPHVVLMDVMMPRFNGFTICHAILSKDPKARVILMSGRLSSQHPFVHNSGAALFLHKPLRFSHLREVLATLDPHAPAMPANARQGEIARSK